MNFKYLARLFGVHCTGGGSTIPISKYNSGIYVEEVTPEILIISLNWHKLLEKYPYKKISVPNTEKCEFRYLGHCFLYVDTFGAKNSIKSEKSISDTEKII